MTALDPVHKRFFNNEKTRKDTNYFLSWVGKVIIAIWHSVVIQVNAEPGEGERKRPKHGQGIKKHWNDIIWQD